MQKLAELDLSPRVGEHSFRVVTIARFPEHAAAKTNFRVRPDDERIGKFLGEDACFAISVQHAGFGGRQMLGLKFLGGQSHTYTLSEFMTRYEEHFEPLKLATA